MGFFLRLHVVLIACFAFLQSFSSYASTEFESQFYYFEDKDQTFSIAEITEQQFKDVENGTMNFGFYQGAIWIKATVESQNSKAVLELRNPNLDIIRVYYRTGNTFKLKHITGDHFKFRHRTIQDKYFRFPVDNNDEVYIQIVNYGDQLVCPIGIYSTNDLAKRDYNEQLISGIFFGLCLFSLFLNVFMYLVVGDSNNLMYSVYLLGAILLQLALSGLGFEYLWPNSVFIAKHAPPFFASFSIIALILFTRRFLNVQEFVPRLTWVLNVISVILYVNLLFSIFDVTYFVSVVTVNAVTFLLVLIIIPISVVALKNKYKPARFFLGGFLMLMLCVIGFVLRNAGFIESNAFTDNLIQIGTTIEVLFLSFAIIDKFKTFRDDAISSLQEKNQLQIYQNELLEQKVNSRTAQISEQKNQLEQTNREIIDSINYAKRIQTALIPSQTEFKSNFKDSFVFWSPKDIVSGDFYWSSKVQTTIDQGENESLIAFCVGDCTGHGVPGALLSVLGLKILNLSLSNPAINSPAEALNFLDAEIIKTFQNEESLKDGMDISFCALNKTTRKLYFSGAKNGLIIVRNGELIEIKADRFSIGEKLPQESFTQNTVDLEINDMIYLFSDGFADQFGGPNNKKFKIGTLRKLLISIANQPCEEQQTEIVKTYKNWKSDHEQTDDVCILGVRI